MPTKTAQFYDAAEAVVIDGKTYRPEAAEARAALANIGYKVYTKDKGGDARYIIPEPQTSNVWDNGIMFSDSQYGADLADKDDWHLHKPDGSKVGGGFKDMNPANPEWRKYFFDGVERRLQSLGYSRVFIDNAHLSRRKVGELREYATDREFREAWADFLRYGAERLGRDNMTCNAIESRSFEQPIDPFLPNLSAVMFENFGGPWGTGYSSDEVVLRCLTECQKVTAAGARLIAVTQGQDEAFNTRRARFFWSLYQLIADDRSTFRYIGQRKAPAEGAYKTYYHLPEYDLDLGTPVAPFARQDKLLTRRFSKMLLTVDLVSRSVLLEPTDTPPPPPPNQVEPWRSLIDDLKARVDAQDKEIAALKARRYRIVEDA